MEPVSWHGRPRWAPIAALAAGLLALLAYLALQQHTLYSVDAHGFLIQAQRGDDGVKASHFAYQPLLVWCTQWGARFGWSLHASAVGLSALGTALGVAAMQLANQRLGLTRGEAAFATAAAAALPAVVFYATVVEIHGQHFAFCGLSFVATVYCAERPSWWRGCMLGVATAAGYLGHATGALLPALTTPLCLALAAPAQRRRLLLALGCSWGVHGALLLAMPWLFAAAGAVASNERATTLLLMHLGGLWRAPLGLLDALWRDYLLPFSWFGWLPLLLLGSARLRWLALSVLLAVLVYVVATAALLVPFQDGVQVVGHGTERGAYLLPLAWPLGLLAAAALRQRTAALGLWLSTAALAIFLVQQHDTRPQQPFARGFREVVGSGPSYTLLGTHHEVAAVLLDLPQLRVDRDWQQLLQLSALSAEQLEPAWQAFDGWLRQKHQAGISLWLTAGGLQLLTEPGWTRGGPAAPVLLQRLRQHYEWQAVAADGFSGWRLLPR